MYPFVEKEKEKRVVFSLIHISTKKPPALFFQPHPTPYYSNPQLLIIIAISNTPLLIQPLLLFGSQEYVDCLFELM